MKASLLLAARRIGDVLVAALTLFLDFEVLAIVASGDLDWFDGFVVALVLTVVLDAAWRWVAGRVLIAKTPADQPSEPPGRQ